MKKYMILAALAAMILLSCEKENSVAVPQDGRMQFDMTWSAATKATATAFEEGDAVGLYVVGYNGDQPLPMEVAGNWMTNDRTVYGSTGWTPETTIYWPESKVDVYGYYPFGKVSSIEEQPFQVSTDQSTDGYEKSDFMWAKAEGVVNDGNPVRLVYRHRMSHLVVNLVKGPAYEGDLPEEGEIIIHSTTPSAIIDMASGLVMSNPSGRPELIKMRKLAKDKFDAIVVPQRLEGTHPLIEYLANGVSYMYNSSFYFKPGKEHVLNLTINANPDQVSVEIGGQIDKWN